MALQQCHPLVIGASEISVVGECDRGRKEMKRETEKTAGDNVEAMR